LRQAYWIEAQRAIIGSRAVTLKFSNIGILQLLERLTIALFLVFLVAALVLVIKYDIERTAAGQPATRMGSALVPRCARPFAERRVVAPSAITCIAAA
jgi:hypothetical protein